MKTMRVLAAGILLSVINTLAIAASPQAEGAVKALQNAGGDGSRLKIFCELTEVDEKLGDRKDPALEAQMDKLLDQLGADFKAAWDLVEDVDENSPDGKVLNSALDQLSRKCS
jgi:hypothetical protein